jgi:fructose-bisphosphate aldolase class II
VLPGEDRPLGCHEAAEGKRMALVGGREVLAAARAGRYAVPAFNVFNLEMLQAVYRAAEAERAAVIVQVSPRSVAYAGLRPLAVLAAALAEPVAVPIVLHLDHGPDLAACRDALAQGFTSVMFDGASLPFDENVARTREVVALARATAASAEAELGEIGHASHAPAAVTLTDPEEAARFVTLTGVDALAVAIGTVHGMRETGAVLDIPRIATLRQRVDAALVMHGSSGVDDDTLVRAIEAGIVKVNLSTALQRVFMDRLRDSAAEPGHETDARAVLGEARDAVEEAIRHRIRLVGAADRA